MDVMEKVSMNYTHAGSKYYLYFFLLSVFIFVNLLFYIEKMPLIHEEPRRAVIAQEMLLTHNFISPEVFQKPYVKKPPLQNWAIALLAYKNKFVSNTDARLPSILSLIILGLSIFLLLKNNPERAFWAASIAMTSYVILNSYGNKAEPDLMVTMFTFLAYAFYIIGEENIVYIAVSSIFMGLGILTKGVSPIFFYPGIILYMFFYKKRRFEHFKYLFLHMLLSLILPALWLFAYHSTGNVNNIILGFSSEAASRTTSGFIKFIKHILIFPIKAVSACLPWSILIFFAYKKKNDKKDKIYNSSLMIFLFSFALMEILPGGRGRYFMPAIPFLSIAAVSHFDINKVLRENILKYTYYFMMIIPIIVSVYFLKNGYIAQSIMLLFLAVSIYIASKSVFKISAFGLISALYVFILYIHGIYFYKSRHYYNYRASAEASLAKLDNNLPLVTGNPYPIQLIFNLERYSGRVVYSESGPKFKQYILISSKKSVDHCSYLFDIKYTKKHIPRVYFLKCKRK